MQLLAAVCHLLPAHGLPAAEPRQAGQFEKLLAEKPVILEGVVYKKTTADDQPQGIRQVVAGVRLAGDRKAATDDLSGDILICGPGLWHNIKDDPEMQKLKLGVTKINVPTNNGVQVLDGKLFQARKRSQPSGRRSGGSTNPIRKRRSAAPRQGNWISIGR